VLRFDPNREPSVPKDAATVVVVRELGGQIELFCVERHARSGFLGGAIVFPGGKCDAADSDPAAEALSTALGERAREFAAEQHVARTFAIAALRELFEEAAILPVVGDCLDNALALALRAELSERQQAGAGATAFFELLRSRQLVVDTARLAALGRWITPTAEPRRYDTRFYVLPLPPGQAGEHDARETTSSFWATPTRVLERWAAGEIFLAPPTSRTIEILALARSVDDVLAIASRQPLAAVMPHFVLDGDQTVLTLPGDPLHPERAAPPDDPTAPTRFVLRNGRFIGERR
jgi:8-oxo-dGTP pyrophosphatase MutT (NUDIX family)